MNRLTVYRFVSYLLLPIAVLLGLAILAALLVALGNVAMLLSFFITGATVLYIFTSFTFLQRGISKQLPLKTSFKDLIKVNGYVALFFCIMGLMQGIMIFLNPAVLNLFLNTMPTMQPKDQPLPDAATLMQLMKNILYFMIVLCSLLLFHISTTFRYLKQHAGLFVKA